VTWLLGAAATVTSARARAQTPASTRTSTTSTMDHEDLKARLRRIDTSQKSIQDTSGWCRFHRKEYKTVVKIWYQEFSAANVQRKMALLWLCNDIVQNGRKEGQEFTGEFFQYLPNAIVQLTKGGDAKIHNAVSRLLSVWKERLLFGNSGVPTLLKKTGFKMSIGSSSSSQPDFAADPRARSSPSVAARQKAPSSSSAAADCEEVREVRALMGTIDRRAVEKRRLEAYSANNDFLSTSAIVSASADQDLLNKYQKLMWDAIQDERQLVTLLENWRRKVEDGIQAKEGQVRRIKKDLLARKEAAKEAAAAEMAAATAAPPAAIPEDPRQAEAARVAEQLASSENPMAKLQNALQSMSEQDKQKLSALLGGASQEAKNGKRLRSEM